MVFTILPAMSVSGFPCTLTLPGASPPVGPAWYQVPLVYRCIAGLWWVRGAREMLFSGFNSAPDCLKPAPVFGLWGIGCPPHEKNLFYLVYLSNGLILSGFWSAFYRAFSGSFSGPINYGVAGDNRPENRVCGPDIISRWRMWWITSPLYLIRSTHNMSPGTTGSPT
jgi:hypothetical protein